MSGHLCLKWNNHSSSFLSSISQIHLKEKYCDATIACQGKYFPVHRMVLSTCSEYFEEIFGRIQCPHPYVVFKDIAPEEMELLLNYMYLGEVNVVQECLPTLIKAAEALKIKGLAVPDDDISDASKSISNKRKNSTNNDEPQSKRKADDRCQMRRRRDGDSSPKAAVNSTDDVNFVSIDEPAIIKSEPIEEPEAPAPMQIPSFGREDSEKIKEEVFVSEVGSVIAGPSHEQDFVSKDVEASDPFEDHSTSWSDFGDPDNSGLAPAEGCDNSGASLLATSQDDEHLFSIGGDSRHYGSVPNRIRTLRRKLNPVDRKRKSTPKKLQKATN